MAQAAGARVTYRPRQKVVAAAGGSGVASAIAVLVIWGLRRSGVAMPPEVEASLSTVIIAAITFPAGYMMPPGGSETTVRAQDGRARCAIVLIQRETHRP
jgi:hypothetical protein